MKKTYTLRSLLALIVSKLWFIMLMTFLLTAGSFLVSKFAVSPKYESYTTLYVKNNNAAGTNVNPDANVDLNDLNTAKSLAATYITVLKSNSVMEQVVEKMEEKYTVRELSQYFAVRKNKVIIASVGNCFSMSSVDGTEVIKITATTLNPQISADLCNTMAEIAPSFLIRIVGAGSVEIIDEAKPSERAVSPQVRLITLIGFIIGLHAGLLIVLFVDYFDDTIKESEELAIRYKKAVLSEVQELEPDSAIDRKKKPRISLLPLLTDDTIPFYISESSNPSEGKSTTASNIALALAQTGARVLLIDADMRKPVQHKTFKVSNSKGLSTLIIQRSTYEQAINKDIANNLDLLPSGPIPPNPSELLASEQFKSIIKRVTEDYEFIIIDTPPINIVSDTMVLNDSISGILLVLKYGETTYQDVNKCMKYIGLAKANLLGFVLNEIHRSHGRDYFSYKYRYKDYGGYGYGYRQSKEAAGKAAKEEEEAANEEADNENSEDEE